MKYTYLLVDAWISVFNGKLIGVIESEENTVPSRSRQARRWLCFELKSFLGSFKNFVSTFDTILEGFGQLQTDIGDEIRRCEGLEKGGKQKMLMIGEIIERVSPDFDQFGLKKEYLAEIERRRASEGAGSSDTR
ncbi:hypothetical protein CAEBREN_17981 [Caenorhabditis brenneri]|uniref:Uncharacterized protein n=1 Tax=Caenorhabditis brenneri TaxID=135651 RepID=G0PG72_CAEBE|nr:hypothetical protein CAEBREN_17981 [Caenorhabditis brenneri]